MWFIVLWYFKFLQTIWWTTEFLQNPWTPRSRVCRTVLILLLSSSPSDFFRARSIYERALDVDHRNITLWLKYAEMEMKSRQVNHARNIWDRAITILPRVNQFWYELVLIDCNAVFGMLVVTGSHGEYVSLRSNEHMNFFFFFAWKICW